MLRVDMQELEEAIVELGGAYVPLPHGIVDLHTARGRKLVHEKTGMALLSFDTDKVDNELTENAKFILLCRKEDEDVARPIPVEDKGESMRDDVAAVLAKKGFRVQLDNSPLHIDILDAELVGTLVGPEYYCGSKAIDVD